MTTSVDLTMKERYRAAMVLSGVGDALGYFCGRWEFCHSGKTIHDEVKQMKGLKNIHIKKPKWIVSDDTVMHLATAEALMKWGRGQDKEELYRLTAEAYKESMKDMADRAPGLTSMSAVHRLRPLIKKGYQIPFNAKGGGCGAAMRAMCIGLRYPRDEDLSELISYSIESGRMTHHHPTGYLGSFAAALFTAYSVQGKPLHEWGVSMLNTLPQCLEYVKSAGHYVKENVENWSYFTEAWEKYLESRKLSDGTSEAVFPSDYGVEERDKFVKSVSFAGWGGASGHDAPMIAYDALLGSGPDWEELCSRGMFHAGDSDSTAVIAACCYGAMYGFADVPEKNHKGVEYRKRLVNAADSLYTLSQTGDRYLTKETAAATIIPPDTTPKSCEDPGPPPQIPVQEFKDLVELVRTESVEYEDELAKNLEHDLAMQTKPMEKIPEDSDSKTSEGNKPDGQPMETS